MKTKGEAETKLAECDLLRPVVVADVTGKEGNARRSYTFANPHGLGEVEIEIDADPSPEQLADLSRNLPVPEGKRAETLAKLATSRQSIDAVPVEKAV